MSDLLQKLAKRIADELYETGRGNQVDYIMLTNRIEKSKGVVDDGGGYARSVIEFRLLDWMRAAIEDERKRNAESLELLDRLAKGGA